MCPSLERVRTSIETAFGALGVPFAIESRPPLRSTAFGQALLSLLRFAWSNGTRRELFAFLRTPYGGLGRQDVDFLEGRLRGRAVVRGDRTLEETTKLRTGRPLPLLELLGAGEEPLAAARVVVQAMLRNAYGLGAPPVTPAARRDLRAADAASGILDELERLRDAGARGRGRRRALGPRPRHRARRRRRRARARRRPRPHARPHPPVRCGLRDRARAGVAAAPGSDLAVLRRRDAPRARCRPRRPPAAAGRSEPRPLPLLHGLHAPAEAAHARARGGDRRRLSA